MDLLRANADGLSWAWQPCRKKSGCVALKAGALSSRSPIPYHAKFRTGSARDANETSSSLAPMIWIYRGSRSSMETWSTRQLLPLPPAANASEHRGSILKLRSSPPEQENASTCRQRLENSRGVRNRAPALRRRPDSIWHVGSRWADRREVSDDFSDRGGQVVPPSRSALRQRRRSHPCCGLPCSAGPGLQKTR